MLDEAERLPYNIFQTGVPHHSRTGWSRTPQIMLFFSLYLINVRPERLVSSSHFLHTPD